MMYHPPRTLVASSAVNVAHRRARSVSREHARHVRLLNINSSSGLLICQHGSACGGLQIIVDHYRDFGLTIVIGEPSAICAISVPPAISAGDKLSAPPAESWLCVREIKSGKCTKEWGARRIHSQRASELRCENRNGAASHPVRPMR
jgi:hypothetical protein